MNAGEHSIHPTAALRVFVADDHDVVRRGLQQIVATQPGWVVVGEAPRADDVLPALRSKSVDVLILDISLGGRSGIDLLGHVRAEFATLPVLILSMHAEEQYAARCLRAGASGYLQKDSSPADIIGAIERVASGKRYVSAALAGTIADDVGRGTTPPHERLSDREFEVFRLIAEGKNPGEIAESLHVSAKTVSTYRARILEKTGFHSNAELIAYAVREGLV
jgi:two-component system, NarL family, invasion response regulator UvrY